MEDVKNDSTISSETNNCSFELNSECNSIQEFVETGFKLFTEATKSSNRLPYGKGRDIYESYPSFHDVMKLESNRVLYILSKLVRNAGCRANLQNKDDDEKVDIIIEANDFILEKVGHMLDEISGICKNPNLNYISENSKVISEPSNINERQFKSSSTQLLNEVFNKTKNIEKPQLNFKDKVNNDRNTCFEPRIKYKFNLMKPLALLEEVDDMGITHFSHPYQFELDHFKPPAEQLTPVTPRVFKTFEETPLLLVTSTDGIKSMISDLRNYKEIAVDLEHHSYRSFQGFTCLMQISTRDTDYIIDTLILRNDLEDLNEIFTDPKIVKVFHGADSDILWLQRDLALYVVNMFDTHQAAKLLKYPHLSLAYLLRHFCSVDVEKHFQLADWRIRPLPDEFLSYARSDTHYLLYIYDNLKNLIIEKANGKINLLEAVISESTRICLTRYVKPVWNSEGYLDLYHRSKKLFENRQKYALKSLFEWRDNTARMYDESYGYVLPNHMMLHISESLPREAQGILACCNPVPPLVRQHLLVLHQLILKARDQPLVRPVFEEQRLYRSTAENDLSTGNSLRCPHDLNHEEEFRDDLPVLFSEKNNICAMHIVRDEQLISSKPVISVFEYMNKKDPKTFLNFNIKTILTPYQRYKLTKPFSEAQESIDEKAQKVITSNKEKIQEMEINAIQSLKKEPINETVNNAKKNIKKRILEDDVEKNMGKKIKVEEHALFRNPYYNENNSINDCMTKSDKNKKKKRSQEVMPFDYSSINFDKFHTYIDSGSMNNTGSYKKKKKFGRKK